MAIWPGFVSMAVMFVFGPVTFVLTSVFVYLSAVAVSFAFFPLSKIDFTVSMNHSASAVGHSFFPEPIIPHPIRNLHTSPIFQILRPFTLINRFIPLHNISKLSLFRKPIRIFLPTPVKRRQLCYDLQDLFIVILRFENVM